ncbi:MAG: DnaA N-terminal domain-containing protein [Trebonia sp.]
MSRSAIAAALARTDVSAGERLVAFSLASFADRSGRARPGTPAAAARAGLARSSYLEARDQLVRDGLVVVEVLATGRGRASTLALPFAAEGPWWEGDINAELFEAVLGYSRTRGSARLLLAALAALADDHGVVAGVTTEALCAAAGISDRTYRRVCAPLIASGEVGVEASAGGRGHRNRWEIRDPRAGTAVAARPRHRVAAPAGARPLVASVGAPVGGLNPGQERTVSTENHPALSGVQAVNPGQRRTLSRQTPAETPAQTPAANARTGREPQNPRTTADPPNPLAGGLDTDTIVVDEIYVTERGRKRQRQITVNLAPIRERLAAESEADRAAWEQVRALLLQAVSETQFEIWLAPLELIAIDNEGTLVVAAPDATVNWTRGRFGPLLDRAAERIGRSMRIAHAVERRAAETLESAASGASGAQHCDGTPPVSNGTPTVATRFPPDGPDASRGRLMIGAMPDLSSHQPTDLSAHASVYASADTHVHKQLKEVS